jgi:regulator of nonsense transcripts 2
MDIEFLVQDAYMLTRPQWKLLTDPMEASNAFVEIVRQNYQTAAVDKAEEGEEVDEPSASDDEDGADDDAVDIGDEDGDKEDDKSTEDEDDEEPQGRIFEDEEERIVVTRQEDERDPEADADFDRELAKLMSESLDSRKFERKAVFDVPLPMRRAREQAPTTEDNVVDTAPPVPPSNTMKFSLLSKRGNRQQVLNPL